MDNTQRDQQIAAQYLDGDTIPKIAQDHQLSVPSINRILETLKVDKTKRKKKIVEDRLIDMTHERVGQRLYHHRSFIKFEDRSLAAKSLEWSPKKVAMVEQGHTLLTLHDLKIVAAYLNQTLSQLLEDL